MSNEISSEDLLKNLDPEEKYHVKKLRDRLKGETISPEAVGKILPEAVHLGEAQNRKISKSMVEVTERAIESSVHKDPDTLSTALFPVIGAAIRRAINQLLIDTMANMNVGLEQVFSFQRLLWRYQAWKEGVSFLEIVLRNTIQFRVEHVFLIHTRSGILLSSLSREDTKTADDDMVASMLTAVRDYIKDSLSLSNSEQVNVISAGDFSLIIEEGPRATLAVVVRGLSDNSLKTVMRDVLDLIHIKFFSELESYNGDTSSFQDAQKELNPCLISKDISDGKAKPIYAIIFVSLFFVIALFFGVRFGLANSKRSAFIAGLDAQPGMIVAFVDKGLFKTTLKVLHDPRTRSIEEIATEYEIDLSKFIIKSEGFISTSFEPQPDRQVPAELLALAKKLSTYLLLFEQDSGELRVNQEETVREAGDLVSVIIDKAQAAGFTASIEITGHSAGKVEDEASISVSEERAQKAMALFSSVNAPLVKYTRIRGAGISDPVVANEITEEDKIKNRSVTFKALFE